MPVHMLGVAADMKEINKIAKNKLLVIDDTLEALGSKWNNKQMLGIQSDMRALGFDNGKTITTGEGGMITSNNFEFIKPFVENIWIMAMKIIQNYQEVYT